MKLETFRVRDFRSVRDSGAIEVGDGQTCLVGKNESGKTALLHALYRTHPVVAEHSRYDPVIEYPKDDAADYVEAIEAGTREDSVVVECRYVLEAKEVEGVESVFGRGVLKSNVLTHYTHYNKPSVNGEPAQSFDMDLADEKAKEFLVGKLGLDRERRRGLSQAGGTWEEFGNVLAGLDGETQNLGEVTDVVSAVTNGAGELAEYVVKEMVWPGAPMFMYFDEYFQIRGGENLQTLLDRTRNPGQLLDSDYPLLGFIRLAGTTPEKLLNSRSTEDLRNRLGAAGRRITRDMVKYWSQNRHLEVEFDVRAGRPEDPDGMQDQVGMNIWALVRDNIHGSLTRIDKRSRGFVWFFSFLAWYEYTKMTHGSDFILLLDEPGLSLHGKAQHDLLRYFTEELSDHQVIYTTHSPFMFDIEHQERIRVVQDKSTDADEPLPGDEDGTKVVNDVDDAWTTANNDTLFPLLTAMGIEYWQMDIVSKNRLIVEGKSDKDYLDAMSTVLEGEKRKGLSRRWLVAQAGGKGKVSPIVSVFDAQRGLNVAVLLDVDTENDGKIDDLYKKKLLKKKNVRKVSEFTVSEVADIEDMFEREFYVELVNAAYAQDGASTLDVGELPPVPRLVKAVEAAWKQKGGTRAFSHLRPARYLALNVERFRDEIPPEAKNRFEKMFESLNSLLKD